MVLSTVEQSATDLDAEVAALQEWMGGGPRLPLSESVLDEAAAWQAPRKAVADLEVRLPRFPAAITADGRWPLTRVGNFITEAPPGALGHGAR